MPARTARRSSGPTGHAGPIVVAQRGFRLPLEVRSERRRSSAARSPSDEVVQGDRGLGGPDALLEPPRPGGGPGHSGARSRGATAGALLVGRRRPSRSRPDTIRRADRRGGPPRREPPASARWTARGGGARGLFESLDPSRTAAAVASAATARLGRRRGGILWAGRRRLLVAGGVGLPDGATAADAGSPTIATARGDAPSPVVPAADAPSDSGARPVPGRDAAGRAAALGGRLADRPPRGRRRGALRNRAVTVELHAAAAVALRNARLHAESRALRPRGAGRRAPPPTWARTPAPRRSGTWRASWRSFSVGWRQSGPRRGPRSRAGSRPRGRRPRGAWPKGVRRRPRLRAAPRSARQPPRSTSARRSATRCARRSGSGGRRGASCRQSRSTSRPVPPVRVHPDELRHAVHHLLQNAREAGRQLAARSALHLAPAGTAPRTSASCPSQTAGRAWTRRTRSGGRAVLHHERGRAPRSRAGGRSAPWPRGISGDPESRARRVRGRRCAFACPTAAGPEQAAARRHAAPVERARVFAGRRRPGRAGDPGQGLERERLPRHATGDVGEAGCALGTRSRSISW